MTRAQYEGLLPIIKEIEERAHQDPHTNYPDIVAAAQIIQELRGSLIDMLAQLNQADVAWNGIETMLAEDKDSYTWDEIYRAHRPEDE